jgi:hypothetical protein
MIATTKAQGAAMATLVKRVQAEALEDEIERLTEMVEFLKRENRSLQESVAYWKEAANKPAAPVTTAKPSWVVTSDYCKSHNVTMTYLNKALNNVEGYRLDIPGKQSSTGRWLVSTAAVFTHSKKARAQKPK